MPLDLTKYGATPAKIPKKITPEGYIERVTSNVGSDINSRIERVGGILNRDENLVSKGVQLFGQGVGLAANTLERTVGEIPGIKQGVELFGKGVDALSKTHPIQVLGNAIGDSKILQNLVHLYDTSPDVRDSVDAFANTVRLALDVKGAVDTGVSIKNKVSSLTKPKSAPSPEISSANNEVLDSAIRDATPNYESLSAKEKGKYLTRVEEGGVLKGRQIKPDKMNIEAGTELSKVPGYDPYGTKLSKYQVAKAEATKKGIALETSLGNEKVIVPKKEITSVVNKAINQVPNKSFLLQTSDPIIKNYLRVLKNALATEPGNLKGVLKIRKILDDAYENARGKQAFGSDKISALDDVHKAGRDSLTKYLIDHAQNTDVQLSLREQWNLYRALDELQAAAERESGSVMGRFKQNNPILNKTLEMGVKATGFGAGIGIIK